MTEGQVPPRVQWDGIHDPEETKSGPCLLVEAGQCACAVVIMQRASSPGTQSFIVLFWTSSMLEVGTSSR